MLFIIDDPMTGFDGTDPNGSAMYDNREPGSFVFRKGSVVPVSEFGFCAQRPALLESGRCQKAEFFL